MTNDLLLLNLVNYSWQLAALIATGIALPLIFRLREPRSHVVYLQLLLLASVLLPVLQTWEHPVIHLRPMPLATARIEGPLAPSGPVPWNWQDYALVLLLAGIALRFAWLALGLWRLRQYRATAKPLTLAAIDEARRLTGSHAEIAESPAVPGPVAFGLWRPLVLLPSSVQNLSAEAQIAVVTHELLHLRRGDWLFALLEELVTAVLWFHPAIWFLIARIRLLREQAVDRAVVELASSPQPYVHALLTLSAHTPPPLAPQFIRRHDLSVRIHNLLTEVHMSRTRLLATYSLTTALAVTTAWLSVTTFPLQAAPQFEAASSGPEVVLRKAPIYPLAAKQKKIEGTVVVEATLAEDGSVADARVLSGPQELRRAALESVLQWQFKSGAPQSVARLDINFTLGTNPALNLGPANQPPTLAAINIQDAPPAVSETLRARLASLQGQPLPPGTTAQISEMVRAVAPNLGTSFHTSTDGQTTLTISDVSPSFPKGDGPRIRVGGNVQSAKLVHKVTPVYPPLARQARVQGTVRFAALLGKDGRVQGLFAESGHPLLVDAAMQAVREWTYQTTLLNGNPVEVLTAIDVNFTLAP